MVKRMVRRQEARFAPSGVAARGVVRRSGDRAYKSLSTGLAYSPNMVFEEVNGHRTRDLPIPSAGNEPCSGWSKAAANVILAIEREIDN
jgi:hypothetical protein